jgi:hypothetical protein
MQHLAVREKKTGDRYVQKKLQKNNGVISGAGINHQPYAGSSIRGDNRNERRRL